MSIWGEEVLIKLLVFQEILSLTKILKGTKQTKRDDPHKEERQAKKICGGKERINMGRDSLLLR